MHLVAICICRRPPHRPERRGFLTIAWGTTQNAEKAKFYKLTPSGEEQLEMSK